MPDEVILTIMRTMAATRRQRLLATLASGPTSLPVLADRLAVPEAEVRDDIDVMETLQLVRRIGDGGATSSASIGLGVRAEVNVSTDYVHFQFKSPDGGEIKLTRRREPLDS